MKIMKLVDKSSGLMVCKSCGSEHYAQLKQNGFYYRGAWQCINGCKSTAMNKDIDHCGLKS